LRMLHLDLEAKLGKLCSFLDQRVVPVTRK
jgi:hypothetical protein